MVASISNLAGTESGAKYKVALDVTSQSLSEGSSALINVTLSERRDQDTVIAVSLSSVRNDVAADFMPVVASVTIPAHELSAPLFLTTKQDSIYETNEDFSLFLYCDDVNVTIERAQTTITVIDDEAPPIANFALASQNINEGAGTGTITVTLNHESAFTTIIPYTVTDGSAGPADYTMPSGSVTFAPGEVSKTLSFSMTDDLLVEPVETFTVQLAAGGSNFSLGATTTHTVNIIDNETTNLTIDDVSVTEGGSLIFTVTLSAPSSGTVQFDWATSAGTAVAGVNYTNASATESVPPGGLTRIITIPTVNTPGICEADRTVMVTLSNAVNATIADGTGLGTITDDDLPTLSISNASGPESGAITFTATLSASCPTKAVTFTWSNAPGTATAGTDYAVITNAPVTIAAGSTSASLITTPVNDTIHESNETFTVSLSNIVNATPGTTTAIGTIIDDDVSVPMMLKDINLAPAMRGSIKMSDARIIFENSDTIHGNELWVTDGTEIGTKMILDINPGLPSSFPGSEPDVSYAPRSFFLNTTTNVVFFLATRPDEGTEIWRTDGTPAGTFIVADTEPGTDSLSEITYLGETGNRVLMYVVDSGGYFGHVWSSDGTAAGTFKVATSRSWMSASVGVKYNGLVYFGARVSTNGTTLWRSDGTNAGTVIVKETGAYGMWDYAPAQLQVVNGKLYFIGYNSSTGKEPWISDGTTAGTTILRDIYPSSWNSGVSEVMSVGSAAIFGASDASTAKIWVTDGTPTATTSIASVQFEQALGTVAGKAIFVGYQSGSGAEPWVSDGSSGGTFLLKDLAAGTTGSMHYYANQFAVANGHVIFVADDGVNGSELWTTDGTTAGTQLLKDIYPGSVGSNPTNLTIVGTKVVFSATSADGNELWITDGTPAGTGELTDAVPGSASLSPANLTALNGSQFYFMGFNPAIQTASAYLGDVNGTMTAFGSILVPNDSSQATNLAALGGNDVVFGAYGDGTGNKLWRSDGTESGTLPYADIFPAQTCVDITQVATYGSSVFFQASTPGLSMGLMQTDGTYAGTTKIVNANGTTFNSFLNTPVRFSATQMIFDAIDSMHGREPWITDGTTSGTFMIKDLVAGTGSGVTYFQPVVNSTQHRAYFAADTGSSTYNVWVSDGTTAGTVQLTALGTPTTLKIFPAGTKTYFGIANSNTTDLDLWVSDGTNANTVKVSPAGSYFSMDDGGVVVGEKFFFSGRNDTYGSEPWVSDGTPGGTFMLKDLTAGASSTSLQSITVVGSKVIFGDPNTVGFSDLTSAGTSLSSTMGFQPNSSTVEYNGKLWFSQWTANEGYELWSTDGTLAGTTMLTDIYPGGDSSNPDYLTVFNSKLYFSANDGVHGEELWESDGTAAGTKLVMDVNPGAEGSTPNSLQVTQGKLYWKATTLMNGSELWKLEP
jgi:ELWxxDGT repeat protein